MSTKSFTIWNTNGNNRKDFESNATTLEELQRDFTQHGISYNNMSIIVGETQVSLESKQALIPDVSQVTLFLFPKKVKSGGIDKVAVLKTFKRSNKEAKLRIAKKNGYTSIDSFLSFLEGKGSKAPVKPTTPTKVVPVKKELPKAVKKGILSPLKSSEPTKAVAAKMSDDQLRGMADRIKSSLPY